MSQDNVFKFERRVLPPPPPEDFDTESALGTCAAMLKCLSSPDLPQAANEACVVLLLINLNDLAARAKAEGKGMVFIEHVDQMDDVQNITDLISKLRNAACHIRSKSRSFGGGKLSFASIFGYGPRSLNINGNIAGCDFHDDVAIYYGPYRFYLRRHAARAVEELTTIFASRRR